ncbi:MAG: hypothetical protein AAFR04_02130 [Pseudomonadota bacterium]
MPVPDFYNTLINLFKPLLTSSAEAFFIGLFLGIPLLLGLLVTLGRWRAVLKAALVWHAGLFVILLWMTRDLNQTLHGYLVYAMFFSVLAVPVLSVIFAVGPWLVRCVWPAAKDSGAPSTGC